MLVKSNNLPKGKKHWRWSFNPSKLTLHKRIHRKHGKASNHSCVDCGGKALDWSNNTGKYTDRVKDYVPRCRRCHVMKDESWKKNKSENWKKLKRDSMGRFKRLVRVGRK